MSLILSTISQLKAASHFQCKVFAKDFADDILARSDDNTDENNCFSGTIDVKFFQ